MGNTSSGSPLDPMALARLVQAVTQRQTAAGFLGQLLGPFASQPPEQPMTEEQSRMGVTYPAAVQPADILGLLAGSTRTGLGKAVLGSERGAVGEAKLPQILSEKGEPLEVYHGTTAGEFEQFQPRIRKNQDMGFGIHFAEDKGLAEQYATDPTVARPGKSPRVYTAQLSAKKPLIADQIVREGTPEFELAQKLAGKRLYTGTDESGAKVAYLQGAIDSTSPARAERLIREAGYDAVKYKATLRGQFNPAYGTYSKGTESDAWIVFDPNQIKIVR